MLQELQDKNVFFVLIFFTHFKTRGFTKDETEDPVLPKNLFMTVSSAVSPTRKIKAYVS